MYFKPQKNINMNSNVVQNETNNRKNNNNAKIDTENPIIEMIKAKTTVKYSSLQQNDDEEKENII